MARTRKAELARITHPDWQGNALILYADWTWQPTDPAESAEAAMARAITAGYEYSPAHGYPGGYLARKVAEQIKGSTVELPPREPDPPGVVY